MIYIRTHIQIAFFACFVCVHGFCSDNSDCHGNASHALEYCCNGDSKNTAANGHCCTHTEKFAGQLSIWEIVSIVIGCIILLVAVSTCICCCCCVCCVASNKRRRRHAFTRLPEEPRVSLITTENQQPVPDIL